ncbi:MAG: hypothetical protein JSS81_07745 [Acidobacteria bacterium]|nr:hypothetical protein [Acidobacteriota bacterium]
MLTQCVNCGFYFRRTDEFCLNCGIVHPNESLKIKKSHRSPLEKLLLSNIFLLVVALSFVVLLLYLVAERSFENLPYLQTYIWIGALVSGGVLLFALRLLRDGIFGPKLPHVLKHKNNLTSKIKIIDRRLAELENRGRRIAAVLDKIRETDGGSLPEVRRKLLTARGLVASQFERYDLQRKKIELVRLQNGVSPYLYGLSGLSEIDTENGLTEIESTRDELRDIRRRLQSREAAASSERAAFIAQLDETEASCQKIREALLSRQAARALQEISSAADDLRLPGTARESDIFNVHATLTDFSESFEELEREYQRLKAEAETEQKLLTE